MNLREALEDIQRRKGRLTPAIVVEASRPQKAPLHGRFEWDDTIAGEAWRRVQAHELIRSVRVGYTDRKGAPQSVRAWHAIPRPDSVEPVYERVEDIVADPFMTEIIRTTMRREWLALKRRYEHFEEFWRMVRGDADAA